MPQPDSPKLFEPLKISIKQDIAELYPFLAMNEQSKLANRVAETTRVFLADLFSLDRS